MDEKRQIGPAISKARRVTQSELRMKGKKPNLPDIGFHSLEKSISDNEWFSSNNDDFQINPMPKATGKMKINNNQQNIQTWFTLSAKSRDGLRLFVNDKKFNPALF
jgi:hypothetical protein